LIGAKLPERAHHHLSQLLGVHGAARYHAHPASGCRISAACPWGRRFGSVPAAMPSPALLPSTTSPLAPGGAA
jgi:hypothetical protein